MNLDLRNKIAIITATCVGLRGVIETQPTITALDIQLNDMKKTHHNCYAGRWLF